MKTERLTRFHFVLIAVACAALALAGCDDSPTNSSQTTTTIAPTPAPSPTIGRLRVAQLTLDARSIDLAVDGKVVTQRLPYRAVGPYVELTSGEYRVQILPTGKSGPAVVETIVAVTGGSSQTVAVVGNDPVGLITMEDNETIQADRAEVRFFNAVRDFPATFDLAIVNGPTLMHDVAYLGATEYAQLAPGNYQFSLRRHATSEDIAAIVDVLPASVSTTVFAVGTLMRDDIELTVARDEF